jgi:hypothetical protein
MWIRDPSSLGAVPQDLACPSEVRITDGRPTAYTVTGKSGVQEDSAWSIEKETSWPPD